MPKIASMTPSTGSIYGGTVVAITGNGFSSQTVAVFGDSTCTITKFSLNSLSCVTSSHSDQQVSVQIR